MQAQAQIHLTYAQVSVSTFDEKLPHGRFPSGAEYAMETARHKALEVAMRIPAADLVIGADTVRPSQWQRRACRVLNLCTRAEVHAGKVPTCDVQWLST
eukprot:366564-Chlamydomonas_euryale.AAC.8